MYQLLKEPPHKRAYGLLPEQYKYSSIMTYCANIALGYKEKNVAINGSEEKKRQGILIYMRRYLII